MQQVQTCWYWFHPFLPHLVIPEGATTCKPVSCPLYSRWDLGGPKDPDLAIVAAAVGALPNI